MDDQLAKNALQRLGMLFGYTSRGFDGEVTVKAQTDVVRLERRTRKPAVQVLKASDRLEVWQCQGGTRRSLTGTVNVTLAADALRHGQDLVEELVEKTLKEIDRQSPTIMRRDL